MLHSSDKLSKQLKQSNTENSKFDDLTPAKSDSDSSQKQGVSCAYNK